LRCDSNVSDHLANERTYLAWIRTSIAIVALGFVVARFGLFLGEISPVAQSIVSIHFSSVIGVALVVVGGLMELTALRRFLRNQERIQTRTYEPTALVALGISAAFILGVDFPKYYVFRKMHLGPRA